MPKHKKVFQPAPRQMCDGKTCYQHKVEAEAVKIEQELLTRDLSLKTYRCNYCQMWHLTRAKPDLN